MLNDKIIIYKDSETYNQFTANNFTTLLSLIRSFWNIEKISGSSNKYLLLAQYQYAYNYANLLYKYVSLGNHTYSTINTLFEIDSIKNKLSCTGIDLLSIFSIFGIKVLNNEYIYIESTVGIELEYRINDFTSPIAFLFDYSPVTPPYGGYAYYSDSTEDAIPAGSPIILKNFSTNGLWKVKIIGKMIPYITLLSFVGSADNYLYRIKLSSSLTKLKSIDVNTNYIKSSDLNNLTYFMYYCATANNYSSGNYNITDNVEDLDVNDPLILSSLCYLDSRGYTLNLDETYNC